MPEREQNLEILRRDDILVIIVHPPLDIEPTHVALSRPEPDRPDIGRVIFTGATGQVVRNLEIDSNASDFGDISGISAIEVLEFDDGPDPVRESMIGL